MTMRWHRLWAITRKETIHILRDPRSLLTVLLMPVMLMLLLGYGVSLDAQHLPVCAYDREGSQASQDLLKRFASSHYFNLVAVFDDYRQVTQGLDSGRCLMAVVIPHDFSRQLLQDRVAPVQALIDATDDNTANLLIGYAQSVVSGYSNEVQMQWAAQRGPAPLAAPPLSVEARTWFNEELESRNFVVPGVVAIVMAVVGALLTALTIAREWESGSMEQLIATPVQPLEIIGGKLLPYFAIGLFDTALCAAIGVWWFEVPLRGTLAVLFVTSSVFLLVVLGTGFVVSIVTKSQLPASQFALIATFMPAFLLSGFTFPIEQMPLVIRLITWLVPARYYMTILKAIFLKGVGLSALAAPLAGLLVYALAVGWLATRSFHKRLE